MSNEIIAVMDYIGEKMGIVIDWTQANALPYAQELFDRYISYEIWTSLFYIILSVTLTACVIKLTIFSHKKSVADEFSDWWMLFVVFLTVAAVGGVITLLVSCVQVFDIIACLVFPEKIILDLLQQYIV